MIWIVPSENATGNPADSLRAQGVLTAENHTALAPGLTQLPCLLPWAGVAL